MRLGVMQPYPFPYLGYYELIARTDRWIVFDVVQYNRRSWMNRNRILHPTQGWQYFSLPVAHAPHGTPIRDIVLLDAPEAERRLLAQLDHYRGRAPHFERVRDLVRDAFARTRTGLLVDFNVNSLAATCERLGLRFADERCSRLGLPLDEVDHAGQWALRIAQALGADAYLNPPGGRALFREDEWRDAGIELEFTTPTGFAYDCRPYAFEPALSILDVLMWCRPEAVAAELRRPVGEGAD